MSNGSGDALLEVEDLEVYFPVTAGLIFQRRVADVKAVDGVTFNVKRGETLGLVGESGCGKSTTGKAILQLNRPTAGSVNFGGTDLTQVRGRSLRTYRRRMQMNLPGPVREPEPAYVGRVDRLGADHHPQPGSRAGEARSRAQPAADGWG